MPSPPGEPSRFCDQVPACTRMHTTGSRVAQDRFWQVEATQTKGRMLERLLELPAACEDRGLEGKSGYEHCEQDSRLLTDCSQNTSWYVLRWIEKPHETGLIEACWCLAGQPACISRPLPSTTRPSLRMLENPIKSTFALCALLDPLA